MFMFIIIFEIMNLVNIKMHSAMRRNNDTTVSRDPCPTN